MDPRILRYCLEKGCLIDRDVSEILDQIGNFDIVKKIIESLTDGLKQKIITKSTIINNSHQLQRVVGTVVEKTTIEKICITLGINIELSKEKIETQPLITEESDFNKKSNHLIKGNVKVIYSYPGLERKVEVDDFIKNFRARFNGIKNILQNRTELENLLSISKIGMKRQNLSIIGMVCSKKITKNKNYFLEMEDLTGRINVLINKDKEDLYNICKDVLPDDIIGIKGMGDKDFLFANSIFYPDAYIEEKYKIEKDESIAFISDVHVGSKMFLRDNLLKFIDWINGNLGSEEEKNEALKVKYLFIVGDTVDGVGVYPNQEKMLEIPDIEEQYKALAGYLKLIRKDITIIHCPGQHDSVRIAEPQPPVGKDYANALHELENVILVSNPALIEVGFGKDRSGTEKRGFRVLMYHGASFHLIINEIDDLRMSKAHDSPTKIIKYLLKRRHLSPVHSFNPYIPYTDKDPLLIDIVPDIVATGDLHKSDIDTYNNILMLASSCWQSTTPFEEKVGNHPDPCKVPIFNMKTRRIRVLDFTN